MRVLVAIPHFFRRSRDRATNHGSDADPIEERVRTTSYCLRQLVSILTDNAFQMGSRDRLAMDQMIVTSRRITGDVHLCVSGEDHLLEHLTSSTLVKGVATDRHPRHLGYACRDLFAAHAGQYDLYCFVEDDTAILDAAFFDKYRAFHALFGDDFLLLPNRYEIFGALDNAWKVHLDVPALGLHRPPKINRSGPETLRAPSFGGEVVFERTDHQLAGCYVITDRQLARWMRQDDFHQPVQSLLAQGFDPLEMTMMPMMGALPVYRPARQNLHFLEVHHVPNRLTKLPTPHRMLTGFLAEEVARRGARDPRSR